MPKISEFKKRAVTIEIERAMGVAEADSPRSVLLVQDFSSQTYIGDDQTLDFDSLDEMSAAEVKKLSPQSSFGFSVPLTKPAAGVHPSWSNLIRSCGFNMLDTAAAQPDNKRLIFTHSAPHEIETATIREYQAGDALTNHLYVGSAATGNLSVEFEAGKVPLLKVSYPAAQYVRPSLVPAFVADNSLVNVEEQKALGYDGHIVSQLDGKDICIQSLVATNVDGRDIGTDKFMCRDLVGGARGQVQLEVVYLNPDWDEEFNPFELGESHEDTKRVPFIFHHEMGRIFVEEVQALPPEKIEFGKLKVKCMKQKLNVLKGFEMSFGY